MTYEEQLEIAKLEKELAKENPKFDSSTLWRSCIPIKRPIVEAHTYKNNDRIKHYDN
jgi:hypothetical protein